MRVEAFRLRKDEVQIGASLLPAPVLTYDQQRRSWRVDAAYPYADHGTTVTVPGGFMFDLSSIPRPFRWLVAPFKLSISAPLLHDFLYLNGGDVTHAIVPYKPYSRAAADALFKRIMEREGVPAWRRQAVYLAVRLFGAFAWHG